MLTIIPSVKIAQDTNAANAALQRAADVRKMKQGYYNEFLLAFWEKSAAQHEFGLDRVPIEVDRKMCIESARLPLYASEEVVLWVAEIAKGNFDNAGVAQFLTLMRQDLVSDEYDAFTNVHFVAFMLPPVVSTNSPFEKR